MPPAPKEFLKRVPVAWDDTRFVAGYPGQFAMVARRKGNNWYLAGVNGQNRLREELVKPGNWLGAGRYELVRMSDGTAARSLDSQTQSFQAGDSFAVKMLPYGGFVATLTPVK